MRYARIFGIFKYVIITLVWFSYTYTQKIFEKLIRSKKRDKDHSENKGAFYATYEPTKD